MLRSGDQWRAAARCRKLGIAVHLTKPIRRVELRQAILAALYPGLVVLAPPEDGDERCRRSSKSEPANPGRGG